MPEVADILREAAARFVLPRFRRLTAADARDKGGGDPVTAADLEAEAFLRARLPAVWDAPVVGEEGWGDPDRARLAAGRAWVVDPLDGTRIFLEGDDRFAMIVARVEGGRAVDGWLYFPARDELLTTQGDLRVHPEPAPGRYRLRHAAAPDAAARALEAAGWRPDGPTCWELRRLLTGDPGGYVCSHVTPWDLAAGVALVAAAGGVTRRADGAPVRPTDEAGIYVFGPDAASVEGWIATFGLGALTARSPLAEAP